MRTPAQIYALAVGATLVLAGVLGFFYSADFTSDESRREAVLGILDVNGWDNVVHVATGVIGLAAVEHAARTYALGLGLVYAAVAVWGFALGAGESILSVVPVNAADNLLHAGIGIAGIAAYAATPASVGSRP